LRSNATEPPFRPPVIPAFRQHVDKMVYMYVTEFLVNSGWYAALNADKLHITVHENTVPISLPCHVVL